MMNGVVVWWGGVCLFWVKRADLASGSFSDLSLLGPEQLLYGDINEKRTEIMQTNAVSLV